MYGFDEQGAKRIVRAVREVEGPDGQSRPRVPPPSRRFVFGVEVGLVTAATVTGVNDSNTNPVQWTYTIQPAYKSATGYSSGGVSKWVAIPDTDTITGYNFAEDLNDGSGIQGNGVDETGVAYQAGTWKFRQAIQLNYAVVFLRIPVDTSGTVTAEAWIIQVLNTVDGNCS